MNPPNQKRRAAQWLPVQIRERRGGIAFAYFLGMITNALELLYPWAIGLAVNGLVAGEAIYIWPMVVIWLVQIAIEAVRDLYSARLFSGLNASLAFDTVKKQRTGAHDVSEVSARVEMVEELIDFLEEEAPALFATIISLIGGLAFLLFYDVAAGGVMVALLAPIIIANVVVGVRSFRINRELNSAWERQVKVVTDSRPRRWRVHFGRMARWRVRLADIDVWGRTFAQGLIVLGLVFILFQASSAPELNPGALVAMLAYIFRIEQSVDEVPSAVQQVGRLIDIRRRLDGPEASASIA